MLQSIRDSLTGWVVWFIVGLIAIPFAFVGIESFRMGSRDPVLVQVGDTEITQGQFRAGYDQRYQQLQSMLGDNFRADLINTAQFRSSVLEDMIQEAVMLQYTREAGFRGTDRAVADYLRSIPAFQRDGRFSAEAYREVLSRQGMNPEQLESQLRTGLATEHLREGVLGSVFVPDALLARLLQLAEQERSLSYVTVPAARFLSEVEVSDEQVSARYERDRGQFRTVERLRLAYVVLDRNQLERASDPEPEVLAALYNAEQARFTTVEERRVRHILVDLSEGRSAAREKIEALKAELDGGADFAALAAEHSADSGSREEGGDLGWVQRGQMVENFEQALFALGEGQLSEPVETEFGFHLIRVEEVKASQTTGAEDAEVRERLLELYHGREHERRFQDLQERLEQLAFENSGSLSRVAEALELPLQETDWFTRAGGTGLASERVVLTAAFSPEVLDDDENSSPLALPDGRVVVVRKAEHEPARQRPQEEVAGEIREVLQQEAAQARARAQAEALLASVREGGESLTAAAEQQGLTLRSTGPVKRQNTDVPPAILAQLFQLPRPASADQPVYGLVAVEQGDWAVLALSAVSEPAPNAAQLSAQREAYENLLAGREFTALQAAMRSAIKVRQKMPLESSATEIDPSDFLD